MGTATFQAPCECQSVLEAVLDEHREVVSGSAIDPSGERQTAPAHSIDPDRQMFDIGWLCPVCGRNTVRAVDAAILEFR